MTETKSFTEEVFNKKAEENPGAIQQIEQIAEDVKNQMGAIGKQLNDVSPEEIMKQYLSDPDVIKNSTHWANEFEKRFSGNWFTIEKVNKKTIFKTPDHASQILQVMCLLGLCHVSTEGGNLKYKITLNPQHKIDLLNQEKERLKAEYEVKNNAIDSEIQRLTEKLQ